MEHTVVKVHKDKPTRPAEIAHPVTHRLLRRLRSELDEAFDRVSHQIEEFRPLHPLHRIADFQRRLRHGMPLGSVAAAVDVVEEDKLFRISVELPGIEAKDVEVSVSDDTVVIKAEKKKDAREEQAQSYYLREREYGSFERFIELPVGVDQDKIEAHFANGVLTLELPKTPETIRKHKKIPVQGK
jgi:HSP20 family protein